MRTANKAEIQHVLSKLNEVSPIANSKISMTHTSNYNCWGFTAYTEGWTEECYWLGHKNMETFLSERTYRIEVPQVGDIAVFRDSSYIDNELMHTAILYQVDESNPLFVHKPASDPLEISDLDDLYDNWCQFGKITEYRRKGVKHAST